MKPDTGNEAGHARRDSKDFLRAAQLDRLAGGKPAAVLELSIVPQTASAKTQIEDPTVHWEAKPIPVASILIDAHAFDTEVVRKECKAMAFDPWKGIASHWPLGGVNRARKLVYGARVKVRRSGDRPCL